MSKPRLTIRLDHPVTVEGQRHEALHLRRLKGRDRVVTWNASASLEEVGINLIARLAGVPVAVIAALREDDTKQIGRVVSGMVDR